MQVCVRCSELEAERLEWSCRYCQGSQCEVRQRVSSHWCDEFLTSRVPEYVTCWNGMSARTKVYSAAVPAYHNISTHFSCMSVRYHFTRMMRQMVLLSTPARNHEKFKRPVRRTTVGFVLGSCSQDDPLGCCTL